MKGTYMNKRIFIVYTLCLLLIGLITCTKYPEPTTMPIVNFKPTITKSLPEQIIATESKDTLLTIEVKGTPPYIYYWYKDSTQLGITDSNRFLLKNLQVAHSGAYSVKIKNDYGSDSSSTNIRVDSLFYYITISQSGNGKITPSIDNNTLKVRPLAVPSFTYEPDNGNKVDSVIVNGVLFPTYATKTQFTFNPINTNSSLRIVFRSSQCTLTILPSVNGKINGVASEQTIHSYGDTIKLTTQPDDGFYFDRWANDLTGIEPAIKFAIKSDLKISAIFVDTNKVSLSVESEHGRILLDPPGGIYAKGTIVTCIAQPDSGYIFTNWSDSAQGTSDTIATVMNNRKKITANFIKATQTYSLTLTNINGSVIKNPANITQFIAGDSLSITAIPATGYHFSGWSGDTTITDTTKKAIVIKFFKDRNITANFTENGHYSIIVQSNGGKVEKDPNSTSYTFNQKVLLTAIPDSVHVFSKWSGDITGTTNPYTITIDDSKNITAQFTDKHFLLSISKFGQGSTTPAISDSIIFGNPYTITATPDKNYRFVKWVLVSPNNATLQNDTSATNAKVTLTKASDINFQALFAKQCTLKIVATPSSGANVSLNTIVLDSMVDSTISCAVNNKYKFINWTTITGNVTFSNTVSPSTKISISEHSTISANLKRIYSATYNGNGNTNGTVTANGKEYFTGDTLILPDSGNLVKTGNTFAGWIKTNASGTLFTIGSAFTFDSSDVLFYAKWTKKIYTVAFNANGGSTVATQYIQYDSVASASTPTQNGYNFAGWYIDPGLNTAFNFNTPITINTTLYAKWISIYTVTYIGNHNTGGDVPSDNNNYTSGQSVTILDNSKNLVRSGYTFAGWYTNENGTGGSDRTPGNTFSIGSTSVILYAKWIQNYTVTFDAQGATNPASMEVKYPATTVITLPAAPTKTGYTFAGWWTAPNGGGTQFLGNTPVIQNTAVYAKWEIRDYDGNLYTAVTIGTQTWMVENFRCIHYNDGTPISNDTSSSAWSYGNTIGRYCYYNNTTDQAIITKYGALYNWHTVNSLKLAPSGWHVPSDSEWIQLRNYLILNGYNWDNQITENKIAKSMAAKTDWNTTLTSGTIGCVLTSNNLSGFTALPGGEKQNATFSSFGIKGTWWSSTIISGYYGYIGNIELNSTGESLVNTYNSDIQGFSVRLLLNNSK
jgi:uncharacterized protein (TIGR02145 family)/uncharacterized repeat protein (TIGR02543 family)